MHSTQMILKQAVIKHIIIAQTPENLFAENVKSLEKPLENS